jgi:C4-dicarboxylate-specific signal transduction histidine kinase
MDISKAQLNTLVNAAQAGRTLNNVAHDVNNMLGAIMAYADMMLMDATNTESKQILEDIMASAEISATLLKNLTAITRRYSSSVHQSCSVHEVIEAVERLFSYEFKLGRINISVAIDATVPKAAIRAPHLQRIVMHLVANAIEYLRDQEERWLKVEGVFNEDVITLTILNSGSVIDAAAAEHLFEPLVSTKGNAYAGMGLATARTLAQEAGGDLVYCASTGFELSVPVAP